MSISIVVMDGDCEEYIFEGNLEQWADTFFSNPTVENIREYCEREGWSCTILRDGEPLE